MDPASREEKWQYYDTVFVYTIFVYDASHYIIFI